MATLSWRSARGRASAFLVCRRVAVAIASVLAPLAALGAQLPGLPGAAVPARGADTAVAPGSPRAAVQEFLRLARADDWTGASAYLALPPDAGGAADAERRANLARRLRTVLDQRLALDIRVISPLAVGDTADGSPDTDRLGLIAGASGTEEPVELSRVLGVSTGPRWVFSPSTVGAVDRWFEGLGNPWLRDRLPSSLMREGPLSIFYWQWIGLALVLVALLLVTWLVTLLARAVGARLVRRTQTTWDDLLLEHLRGPFRLWVAALLADPLLSLLDLNPRAAAFLAALTRGMVLVALFWALLRFIRLGQQRMLGSPWASGHSQARTLVPLVSNILRVTLVIVGVLVALAQFGYPVGTLLAGLGIGGIAVALAAQKTVEHLFGSVSLAADRAFRVGDWVRVGTTEGEVQKIGLRSTSFRTNDRTVVRVPNGRLADERIETFGERDRMLLRTDLDLTYDTTPEELERVRGELLETLRAHPRVWPDAVRVHVVAFTESAVRLNVMAWFLTADYAEFLEIRHRLYLEFLRIVGRHATSFAYPSRTVYHVGADGGAPMPAPRERPAGAGE